LMRGCRLPCLPNMTHSPHENTEPQKDFSRVIAEAQSGSLYAREELLAKLYGELRAIAANHLKKERAGHTLQPSALVHEAWLRMAASHNLDKVARVHFLKAAAATIRRVLIDHARIKDAGKRGGGEGIRIELTDADLGADKEPLDFEELEGALAELADHYPRVYQVVQLKWFGDMTGTEIAGGMGISLRSVNNDWEFGKAWLRKRLA